MEGMAHRLAAAMDRARTLAEQTERFIQLSRSRVHASRNSRHHAAMLRLLAQVTRTRSG
jgi:hypothetical protein